MEEKLIMTTEGKRRTFVLVKCENPECQKDFWKLRKEYNRKQHHYCSHKCCSIHKTTSGTVSVICAYCQKSFYKRKSTLKNAKNGLYFCCKKHKDIAQRLDGIKEIHPTHYSKNGQYHSYRMNAFSHYENKCSGCGDNDIRILEVHHIDGDRSHNDITNLMILCPKCHTLIEKGFANIVDNKFLGS